MSDIETGIIPAPEKLLADVNGVRRWRPFFDAISVDPRPQGGRLVRVLVGSEEAAVFDLTADQASHLAKLLSA